MFKFTYWLNDKTWHSKGYGSFLAVSILEADMLFEAKHGINPAKNSNISVAVEVA